MKPLIVVIATTNAHKFRELKALLRVPGIRVQSLAAYEGLPVVRETGRTFEANAVKKARALARATGRVVLADDSGIEVAALGGAPGVQSARFAGRHGDDAANNRKVLRLLRNVPPSKRGARYRCVLALAGPAKLWAVADGRWTGRIATAPAGQGGFGYDPIFVLPARGKTVAQLPAATKHRLSHRAQAARRMRAMLRRLSGKGSAVAQGPWAACC